MNNSINIALNQLRTSLNEVSIDSFVVDTLEALMKIERNEFLESMKGKDKGNGSYSRLFHTLTKNQMYINVPRTRNKKFVPETLELIKINKNQTDEFALALYKKGMTTRDIEDLMKSFFRESISHAKVSNLAKEFNQYRMAWQNSRLETRYLVLFCDCIFINVKRGDRYEREAVYICYGVREDFKREVVAIDINPTESSIYWGAIFEDLKSRGVESVDLIVSDNLTGFANQVPIYFPKANHQKCYVHLQRNLRTKVRTAHKKEVADDLRHVFDNFDSDSTVEKAKVKFENFVEKWSKYYNFNRYIERDEIDGYFTYIRYDRRVRRMIYTNNSIESLNKVIRKGTKNKLTFESPERLLDYIFIILKSKEEDNFMKYAINEYKHFRRI